MSQKWIRSKRWDDEHIPGWAWPIKAVLRALSSIWLAVILLTMVAVYGALASIPIGLVAALPTFAVNGLSLLAAVAVGAGVPAMIASAAMRHAGARAGARAATGLIVFAAFAAGTFLLWRDLAWPRLRYDAGTGEGFMLFADFVQRTRSTTLRRLPGMEMSELEFYSWWPLKVILLAFVVNMIVATVRRIEFTFVNIGVLTVHSGIVTIALGSIYYAGAKQEGDMLLMAGPPDEQGNPTPGPEENGFFDNMQVVLWLGRGRGDEGLEARPIRWLPRYNDYGLNVIGIPEDAAAAAEHDRGRTLSIPVPPARRAPGDSGAVDEDFQFDVVGYASYARLEERWVAAPAPREGERATPMRRAELVSSLAAAGDPDGTGGAPAASEVVRTLTLLPDVPAARVVSMGGALAVEYGRGVPDERWRDLGERLPAGAMHGLIVEVPASGAGEPVREVYAAAPGARIEVGSTGYTLEVQELSARPPFPIITPGYRGAESSVAIVRITPPAGSGAPAFTRFVYHRFPELNQDIVDGDRTEGAMPARRAADPSIRIASIDSTVLQVYLDEIEDGEAVRALVRLPGRDAIAMDRLTKGQTLALAPMVGLRLGERSAHAVRVETPGVVPEQERERAAIGTHGSAAVAVRVSLPDRGWEQTVWVPFSQYLGLDPGLARRITAPDGREVTVVFGRRRHLLPWLRLQLADFRMFPYPHSDVPQDYRSDLVVLSSWNGEFRQDLRSTSLNAPLLVRVPFGPVEPKPSTPFVAVANIVGRCVSLVAPNQYKFSQAGWDADGWRQSKALADAGQAPRPTARYTILGVGNNPGIYVIAAGAVMMSVGIPWAFYLKPYLVRRRKRRIQSELAALIADADAATPAADEETKV